MRYHLTTCLLCVCVTFPAAAQCSIDLPDDNVNVYLGYEPMSCTRLEPAVNGAQPYTLVWSNGLTTSSIEVCANASQWVYVTLQDATPCFATDSVYINVVDVRCGEDQEKVSVCHVPPGNPDNAHIICIAPSAVPAHLGHGCVLGDCSTPVGLPDNDPTGGYTLVVSLAPNPMSTTGSLRVVSRRDQHVRIRALDPMGRVVAQLLDTRLAANEDRQIQLDVRNLPTDLNALWIESVGDVERRMQPLILVR